MQMDHGHLLCEHGSDNGTVGVSVTESHGTNELKGVMNTDLVFEAVQALNREEQYIIALSGGCDSVAALYAFASLKFNCIACHVQHGEESHRQQFAEFCKNLCEKLNVPLVLKKITVNSTTNWEANARHARYQALAEVNATGTLVTAHHLDDQVETFFLKALRGAGSRGLSCMETHGHNPIVKSQRLVRPFLMLEKHLLEHFLMEHGVEWITDPSNNSVDFDRNFLRLDILPLIESRWPNYRKSIAAAIGSLQNDKKALMDSLPPTSVSLGLARTWSSQQLAAWVMNCFATHGSGKCPSKAHVEEFVRQVHSDPTANNNAKYEIRSGALSIKRVKNSLVLETHTT